MKTAGFVFVAISLVSPWSFAQNPPPPETRFLLSLHVEAVDGAFGSLWFTEFWTYNGCSEPLFIRPVGISHWAGIPPNQAMKPGVTPRPAGADPGFFVWLRADQASCVQFNLRAQDFSRQSQTWGTELPVVHESEFRSDKIVLVNVPSDSRFRRTLRVYEALPLKGSPGEVVVRLRDIADGEVLWSQQFPLKGPKPGSVATVFAPGYLELPLNAQFGGADRALVEVEPTRPEMKIWAFLSVTNNETQHFTTITPIARP